MQCEIERPPPLAPSATQNGEPGAGDRHGRDLGHNQSLAPPVSLLFGRCVQGDLWAEMRKRDFPMTSHAPSHWPFPSRPARVPAEGPLLCPLYLHDILASSAATTTDHRVLLAWHAHLPTWSSNFKTDKRWQLTRQWARLVKYVAEAQRSCWRLLNHGLDACDQAFLLTWFCSTTPSPRQNNSGLEEMTTLIA